MTAADFAAARPAIRPSALREVALELPRVRWADVGGLDDVKASLQEAVQWPLAHAASFERLRAKVRAVCCAKSVCSELGEGPVASGAVLLRATGRAGRRPGHLLTDGH